MEDITNRLKKINGQLTGLINMITEKQPCDKIITQFQAAKSALDTAFSNAVAQYLEICAKQKNSTEMKKLILLSIRQK